MPKFLTRKKDKRVFVVRGKGYPKANVNPQIVARKGTTIAIIQKENSKYKTIVSTPQGEATLGIHSQRKTAIKKGKRYIKELKPGGVLITDSTRVIDFPIKHKRMFKFPIFQEAMKQFENESMACVIALGIVASFVNVVTPRAVKLALMARIPKGMENVNEEALKLGYKLAKAKNMITEPEAGA